MSWGSFPEEWVTSGDIKTFVGTAGVLGRSIAALKVAIVLASYRDYETGEAVLSANDLVKLTGTSKPMVLEGVAMLEAMGWVKTEVRGAANTNRYFIQVPGDFRKVPQDTACDSLPVVGLRHIRSLDALKIYLCLLYLRDGQTNRATVSHKKLVEYSGVRPEGVAAATAVLSAAHFIRIRANDEWSRTGHPTNDYHLLGDFEGYKRFRVRPGAARAARRPGGAP